MLPPRIMDVPERGSVATSGDGGKFCQLRVGWRHGGRCPEPPGTATPRNASTTLRSSRSSLLLSKHPSSSKQARGIQMDQPPLAPSLSPFRSDASSRDLAAHGDGVPCRFATFEPRSPGGIQKLRTPADHRFRKGLNTAKGSSSGGGLAAGGRGGCCTAGGAPYPPGCCCCGWYCWY